MNKLLLCVIFSCFLLSSCAYQPAIESSVVTESIDLDTYELADDEVMTDSDSLPVSAMTGTIAAGYEHSLAIKEDGSLWAWGNNYYGQLGNGTTEGSFTPVKIMESVIYVAAGGNHSLAIKADGSLWAWGDNYSGQLGNGTTEDSHFPVKIMDCVSSASAGAYFSMAIKTDGTLWAWGDNYNGTLGDGTASIRWDKERPDENHDKYSPVKIMDSVIFVTTGSSHTLAIKEDNSLWTWGSNYYDVLGHNKASSYLPVKIMDSVVSASASAYTSMAIKKDGSLWEWGNKIGSTPIKKMDSVVSTTSGYNHCMAIKSDGSLLAWGNNFQGALGNGTVDDKDVPVPVEVMNSIVAASAGSNFTLALMSDGSLWAWGQNYYGQLGIEILEENGHTISFYMCRAPVQIMEGVKLDSAAFATSSQPKRPTAQLEFVQAITSEVKELKLPPECEPYRSVLSDYAMLEKSGYDFYCTDIRDSLLACQGGSTYNFGWDEKPMIVYTLYDINRDGTPELLIGGRTALWENNSGRLTGIYTLIDGKPVSVMQGEDRCNFQLLLDSSGNCIIGHTFGRMGGATEFFYSIDESGNRVTLDLIYVNGYVFDEGGEMIGYQLAKSIDGEEVSITQDEYDLLMKKYGIWGYGSMDEDGESREVNLVWKPVLEG